MFRRHHAVYIDSFLFIVKIISLLFFIYLLPDIHSGEIKIFKADADNDKHSRLNNYVHIPA